MAIPRNMALVLEDNRPTERPTGPAGNPDWAFEGESNEDLWVEFAKALATGGANIDECIEGADRLLVAFWARI
jgi:hypothetical protein